MRRVLITGGAGFIGSHAADALIGAGYDVRLLDSLTPQVHGALRQRPSYLHPDAELLVGDVTDPLAVERALRGVEMVLHLASSVGVGQSMYDIEAYVRTNELGTAVLLEALANRPVGRLVVASSMSIYGEGACRAADGSIVAPDERSLDQLKRGDWELADASGLPLEPIATPETKQPTLSSIYALNKYAQERMCLITGKAYGIPTSSDFRVGEGFMNASFNALTLQPFISSLSPSTGHNTGALPVVIHGANFQASAEVFLTMAGQPTITGESVNVISATQIDCVFDRSMGEDRVNPFGNKTVAVAGRAIFTGDSALPERVEIMTIEQLSRATRAIDIRGTLGPASVGDRQDGVDHFHER